MVFHRTLAGWLFIVMLADSGLAPAGGQEPKPQDFSPFVFAVMADPQIGMVSPERDRENFAKVARAINTLKPGARPSIVFIAGDLVDRAGDRGQLALFTQVMKMFAMPVHPVPGNHDVAADGKRTEKELLDGYRKAVGPDKFAVEHGGCLFIGLNSQLWVDAPDLAREQFGWLEQQLRDRERYGCVFILQHHPLYLVVPDEKDQYFNTPLPWRSKLLRLFEQAKVTAVFTGHLHRNLSGAYRGMAMVTTPSTCFNFDGSAFGYRLVTVTADGFTEQYVAVSGMPDKE